MIKMAAAATGTSPQQSEVGMLSITGWGAALRGAIVAGAVGGAAGSRDTVKALLQFWIVFIGASFGCDQGSDN